MIERIPFDRNFYIIVANVRTPEFTEITKVAANDYDHPLANNYSNLEPDRFLFYNIVVYEDEPMMFFGTEHSDWMPPTVARSYARFYKHPKYRKPDMWNFQIPALKIVLDYDEYQPWLDRYGIETLIFTRNVTSKRDAVRFLSGKSASSDRFLCGKGWSSYPKLCNINNTLQHVYWKGKEDLSFLADMHQLDEPPSWID